MVKTRVIAVIVAVLLAVVGTVIVISYVSGAEKRALTGVDTVDVYVVQQNVPAGTPAGELGNLVALEAVPAKVVPAGAVTNLTELGTDVAAVELVPGEQLLRSRFISPTAVSDGTLIVVPSDMQQISVALDIQRALGGRLVPGDMVGVFLSQAAGTVEAVAPSMQLTLTRVLVTGIQGGVTPDAKAGAAASGVVIVTLAVSQSDAQAIITAAEFGSIWLSKEPANAQSSDTKQSMSNGLN